MNREAPVLKFDYRLRNDYCKPIIDYGKNSIITPLVISGVPQGSMLGPILFLIFINDMDCGIVNWLLKFADDAKMFGKVQPNLDNLSLQKDLQRLCDWAKEWQMEFNIEKCKVMHIGNSNKWLCYCRGTARGTCE